MESSDRLRGIKRRSIREYLASKGIRPQWERGSRAMYLSPFRQESNASFSVDYDRNVWYDHGTGEGGSIIDLVARMESCTIGEAINRLERNGSLPTVEVRHSTDNRRMEITTAGPLEHPALAAYLKKRGIDLSIARRYCSEVRYAMDGREYFAIGFGNDAGGWELRNPYFKGSSSPKGITTINNGSDTVTVFEGFFDFLSYLSLKCNRRQAERKTGLPPFPRSAEEEGEADAATYKDTAVLNSVTNLAKALLFLQAHRTVHAFLDNDAAGRKALEKLRAALPFSQVIDKSALYRPYKDLNEYVRHLSKLKPPANRSGEAKAKQAPEGVDKKCERLEKRKCGPKL